MMMAALITLAVVYVKSPEAAGKGLNATGSLILEITPRMIAAFLLAGLVAGDRAPRSDCPVDGAWHGIQRHFNRYDFGRRYARRPDDPFPGDRDVL